MLSKRANLRVALAFAVIVIVAITWQLADTDSKPTVISQSSASQIDNYLTCEELHGPDGRLMFVAWIRTFADSDAMYQAVQKLRASCGDPSWNSVDN